MPFCRQAGREFDQDIQRLFHRYPAKPAIANPNGEGLDFYRFFLRKVLGETGGNGIGKTRADADNGIRVFNGIAGILCAGYPAISPDEPRLLLIKKPFAHQHCGVSNRHLRHPLSQSVL